MINKLFFRSALISTILSYLLIFVGGLVRVSGSGLGCPDWPKCFGRWIPPTSIEEITWKPNQSYAKGVMILHENKFFNSKHKFTSNKSFELYNWIPYTKHDYTKFDPLNTWFEFVNRLIGAVAGFSTLIMFFLSTYEFRRNKILTLLSGLVVLSMGFQAWLGKLVVDSNLSPYKISIHMIMAIVIVCLIIYIIKKADAKY